ncbi:MAG: VWA domain-containing protein [Micrococcales bacterium]|nr:VWA domain-containing protein [Micrococcales bacterium]
MVRAGIPRRNIATATVFVLGALGLSLLPAATAAVPSVPAGSSVVTVKVGANRTGDSAVAPLAGVTLSLYDSAASSAALPDAWATCTSDVDGDCSFVIPGTDGVNRDRRFDIRQTGSPAGWYHNPTMTVTGLGSVPYAVQTPAQLRSGQTYTSSRDFMVNGLGGRASAGLWPQSLDNPSLPAACGLDVALVMDLSYSVQESAALPALKNAARGMTEALVGTSSQVALFTFGARAPAPGTMNVNRPLTPVSTRAGADLVSGWIDALQIPGTPASNGAPAQSTNWDRGLYQVAEQQNQAAAGRKLYDVAVVITDGNPTRYGSAALGDGQTTRYAEVEQAVFSANAVKLQGTRVVALGVGPEVAGAAPNLRAISGVDAGSDYYTVGWEEAAHTLEQLALAGCATPAAATAALTVVKQVVPAGMPVDHSQAVPLGGWTMSAASSVTVAGVTSGTGSEPTAIGTGAASFTVDLGQVTSATVTVDEDVAGQPPPLDGYSHVAAPDGQPAWCRRTAADGSSTDLTVGGTGEVFTVDLAPGDIVSCVVYNQVPASVQPAALRLEKQWVVNGDRYADGHQPTGFSASYQAVVTGGGTFQPLGLGVTYPGFVAGTGVRFAERVSLPLGCTWVTDPADRTDASPTSTTQRSLTGIQMGRIDQATFDETSGDATAVDGPYNLERPLQIRAGMDGFWQYRSPQSYQDVLEPGDNTWRIVNHVTCRPQLVLAKAVTLPAGSGVAPADPREWTLTAHDVQTGQDHSPGWDLTTLEPGYVATEPVAVAPGRTYTLAETGSASTGAYAQTGSATGELAAGATGSWWCAPVVSTEDELGGLYLQAVQTGQLTIPYDVTQVHCAAVNQTAEITARKTVEGGTATPEQWSYSLVPADPAAGGASVTDGAWGRPYLVRPGQPYRIEESAGPAGYRLSAATCTWEEPAPDGLGTVTRTDQSVLDTMTLTLAPGTRAECTFTNTQTVLPGPTPRNPPNPADPVDPADPPNPADPPPASDGDGPPPLAATGFAAAGLWLVGVLVTAGLTLSAWHRRFSTSHR